MTLFGIAFSIFELIFASAFLVFMVLSVSFDKNGDSPAKWIFTVIGIGGVLFFTRESWTLSSLFNFIFSSAFWIPVFKYMGAGIIYSVIELIRGVNVAKRTIEAAWQNFIDSKINKVLPDYEVKRFVPIAISSGEVNVKDTLSDSQILSKSDPAIKEKNDLFNALHVRFADSVNGSFIDNKFLVNPVFEKGELTVKMNKGLLSTRVGSWVLFWPFFLLSLIIGDLMEEVFRFVANLLANIGKRYITAVFKNVFKI